MGTLAYEMNSKTCRTLLKQADTTEPAKMTYETLNCYWDYFMATEKAKEELMEGLQNIASRYDDEGNLIKPAI